MGLARLRASVQNVHALGGLFPTVGFWTRETSVTRHNPAKTSLTPTEFRSTLFLYALHCVHGMLTSRGAVSLDLTRHLDHGTTLSIRPTKVGYLETPYIFE